MKPTNTTEQNRKTLRPLPFYSCGDDNPPLFLINANIPFTTVLDHAQCFMISVEACVLRAAEECDSPEAWGAYYMAQTACALIESMQTSLARESRQ